MAHLTNRDKKLPLSTQAKVERILDKVQRFYELGEQSFALPKSGRRQFDEEVEVDANRMRRARGFAKAYGKGGLRRFLSLRKPDGLPLHVGYIPHLLTVEDAKERRELEDAVVEHGWTVPDLIAEIRWRHPVRPKAHGRRIKPPVSAEAGIQQVVTTGILWMNRSDVVIGMVRQIKPRAKVDERLLDAATQFERLGKKALDAAKELRRIAGPGKA
jgi:hypothetical protein